MYRIRTYISQENKKVFTVQTRFWFFFWSELTDFESLGDAVEHIRLIDPASRYLKDLEKLDLKNIELPEDSREHVFFGSQASKLRTELRAEEVERQIPKNHKHQSEYNLGFKLESELEKRELLEKQKNQSLCPDTPRKPKKV